MEYVSTLGVVPCGVLFVFTFLASMGCSENSSTLEVGFKKFDAAHTKTKSGR